MPEEQREREKGEQQSLCVKSIAKENGVRIVIGSVLAFVCFLIWQVIISNIYMPLFGENAKDAFEQVVSTMYGRIIILVILGMVCYFLYLVLMNRINKQLLFCIVMAILCVVGVLLFLPTTTHSTAYSIHSKDPQLSLVFSRVLMLVYAFGIPMLQGALCLSLFSCKKTLKRVVFSLVAFVGGIVIGILIGEIIPSPLEFSLWYALLGSIAALAISLLLNWREAR